MAQSNTARAANDEPQGQSPVAKFRHGRIELAVWPNQTESRTIYNTSIANSYKDEPSGEWKTTSSFSPTDLLIVGELARQAFAKIADEAAGPRGYRLGGQRQTTGARSG